MQANFKPVAKRLELAAGLDFYGPNFNADSDTAKQLGSLTLKSQSVDMPTTFAIASIRGDKLVLSPLNEALQMRPQLNHLDTGKKKDNDEDEEEEEEKKPEWVSVCTCHYIPATDQLTYLDNVCENLLLDTLAVVLLIASSCVPRSLPSFALQKKAS